MLAMVKIVAFWVFSENRILLLGRRVGRERSGQERGGGVGRRGYGRTPYWTSLVFNGISKLQRGAGDTLVHYLNLKILDNKV